MKTIEGFECEFCNKLHKTEAKAKACEKKCSKTKQTLKQQIEMRKARNELCDYVRLNAQSVEDICRMSVELSHKLLQNCHLLDMQLNVGYTGNTSNSHSAPIGKEMNWDRKADKPLGFPALTGTITLIYNQRPSGFGSEFCSIIKGIHTGSGGFQSEKSGYQVGYGVTLWLDDFPKIKEKIENVQNQIDDYEDLKTSLSDMFYKQVEEDSDVNALKAEVKDIEVEINKLRGEVSTSIGQIEVLKNERYLNQKLLILEEERAKITTEFKGLRASAPSLSEYW